MQINSIDETKNLKFYRNKNFIFSTESRIDCFVINTSPIRSDIEFISRKFWETLTYSLRASILKDLTVLQDFLNTSSQVLQTVTATEEQHIEESAVKCEQIVRELSTVILDVVVSCCL